MSALLQPGPAQLAEIRARAQGRCLAFQHEPLPPGASCTTGRVGIEVNAETGEARLFVDRSLAYSGDSPQVAEWFATGTRAFPDFNSLEAWIEGPLADAYGAEGCAVGAASSVPQHAPDRVDAVEPVFIDAVDLAAMLAGEVVGQADAIISVASGATVHLARTHPRRPMTALLLGPTGVGKTLLAETIAEAIASVSGQSCDYLRLDMTEFQERHAVAKLFGAPPGYVGYLDTPSLVDKLRSSGRVVVLLDEIEKAHPDVFTGLMNLLDAGRITPASGETVDARHAILLFTTNLGADTVLRAVTSEVDGEEPVARDARIRTSLRTLGITPALVGRLDRLCLFTPLNAEHLDEVLRRTIHREAATFGFEVASIGQEVLATLRTQAPDGASGVRAWEHLVNARLGSQLAQARRRGVTTRIDIHSDPVMVSPAGAR